MEIDNETKIRISETISFFKRLDIQNCDPQLLLVESKKCRAKKTSIYKTSQGQCSICMTPDITLYRFNICEHDPSICKECLHDFMSREITYGDLAIHCWSRDCPSVFPLYYLNFLQLPKESLNVYQFKVDKNSRRNIGYCFCASPLCKTNMYCRTRSGGLKRLYCNDCEIYTCVKHGIETNYRDTGDGSGYCCEVEYETGNTEETIVRTTKRCPSCFVVIEKNGGCPHMTCRNCKHEFCWGCLTDYVPEHTVNGRCPINNGGFF